MPVKDTRESIAQRELPAVHGRPLFSNEEMSRRHANFKSILEKHDLAAIVVGNSNSLLQTEINYLTRWQPLFESYLVLARDSDPVLFMRLWNHTTDAREISYVKDVRYGGDRPPMQTQQVIEFLKSLGCDGKRVGLLGALRYQEVDAFRRALPKATWVDISQDYRMLRTVKSAEEMDYIRISSAMNDRAVKAMADNIVPGMRECDIAKIIEDTYLADRGTNLIHFTLSTSMDNPDRCVPHQYPPDRIIQKGDCIVTEISTNLQSYAGQILRSFTVGTPPNGLYQQLYDVAFDTYTRMAGMLRAGTRVGDLLDAAQMIHEAGFNIWDDLAHGFGGGYLSPVLRTRETGGADVPDDWELPAGALIVIQPNVITRDNKAGVQIGNCFHIEEDGAEVLQRYPMEFIRCG